ERSDPRMQPIGAVASWLRTVMYRRASAIVVQTLDIVPWAEKIAQKDRVYVIPNPVDVPASNGKTANGRTTAYTAVAVGRLSEEKGFDLLLNAFAQTSKQHPNWNLRIIGEGPQRGALTQLAHDLGLAQRVQLLPPVKDIFMVLREADLF